MLREGESCEYTALARTFATAGVCWCDEPAASILVGGDASVGLQKRRRHSRLLRKDVGAADFVRD